MDARDRYLCYICNAVVHAQHALKPEQLVQIDPQVQHSAP